MSCSGNRCNMSVGGSGGTNNPIPPAQHTPYPAGANSASDAARINGNNNVDNQTELGAAFKGGSGGMGRIVVPQHQEVSASQSGNQGANQTSASTAQSLSQGHENAKMDHLVGGRKRRRTRKYMRSNKSTYKRRKRNTKRKASKSRRGSKASKSRRGSKASKSRRGSKTRKSLKRCRVGGKQHLMYDWSRQSSNLDRWKNEVDRKGGRRPLNARGFPECPPTVDGQMKFSGSKGFCVPRKACTHPYPSDLYNTKGLAQNFGGHGDFYCTRCPPNVDKC